MFLNDKRLCDTCIFMADSCHLDMCLHPLRRARGKLGKMINNALVWNGDCSVYIQGKPCFYELIEYRKPKASVSIANSSEPKEIWKYSEQVYQLLVRRFAESGKVAANDLAEALAQKHIRYAMEA